MQDFIKNNWFKIGILLVLLTIALSVAYYYVMFIPEKEAQREANRILMEMTEENRESERRENLDSCLRIADMDYSIMWDSECKVNSMDGKKEDCMLPKWVVERIEDNRTENKNNCFKKYPQK